MQTLRNLLLCIANINLFVGQLHNQAVQNAILKRIKDASAFGSTDFVDVANFIDDAIQHDYNLSEEDVARLRAISKGLKSCNQHLHLTQNLILSA